MGLGRQEQRVDVAVCRDDLERTAARDAPRGAAGRIRRLDRGT